MSPHCLLVPGATLKVFECLDQASARGLVKEDSRDSFNNCLHRAPTAECDHRAARRVYLKRHHAKIFLTRKQERPAAAGIAAYLAIWLTTQEFCLRSCKFLEPLAIRTITDDYQPAAQTFAGFACQIDTLVRHQPREYEIVVIHLRGHLKSIDINWRWNDKRLAAVNLFYAL